MTNVEKNDLHKRESKDLISVLLIRISNGTISKEKIEKQDIDTWQKDVLLVAWYERIAEFKGVPVLKKLKIKYEQDSEMLQIVKQFLTRFKTKGRNRFDINVYVDFLQCSGWERKIKNRMIIGTIPEESVSW